MTVIVPPGCGRGTGYPDRVVELPAAPPPAATTQPPARCAPVVAVIDMGCGEHPWLRKVRFTPLQKWGAPNATGPREYLGAVNRPLDGLRDPLAGHGTFICGLVRQVCPDADIIAIPVIEPDGTIPQSNLVAAIDQITAMVKGGDPVDVVSVSMGHYHETPADIADTAALYTSLRALTGLGVVVVMSAGNDCTARESYPAALAEPGRYTWDVAPVVSVGALNPDGRTVAMFSNTGGWVTAWESGAALVSTMPEDFQFSLQATARTKDVPTGKERASVDPDDFSSGFAIASGTSFATPVVAGRIARRLAALGALDLQQTELRREAVRQVITR